MDFKLVLEVLDGAEVSAAQPSAASRTAGSSLFGPGASGGGEVADGSGASAPFLVDVEAKSKGKQWNSPRFAPFSSRFRGRSRAKRLEKAMKMKMISSLESDFAPQAWPEMPCDEIEVLVHAVAQFLAGVGP